MMCRCSIPVFPVIAVLIFIFKGILGVFNLEELKPVNYEVDILRTPAKLGLAKSYPKVYISSKHGQQYQCLLPQVPEKDDASDKKDHLAKESTDIRELLRPIQAGSCLLKAKDWWTYEFCFGHYIKQYHVDDGKIVGQIITLGLYESDYDWDNETNKEKFIHVKPRYHSQIYSNGSKCDLTGTSRSAEVRFFCEEDAGDYIQRVDEPGTCSYVLTVHTSRICSHPQLKPLPSNKAHSISCNPVVSEKQYTRYMQKIELEKAAAEAKRNQFLTSQQERLKMMKKWAKENLIKLEEFKMERYEGIDETKKVPVNDGVDKPLNLLPKNKGLPGEGKMMLMRDAVFEKPRLRSNDIVENVLYQEYDEEIEVLQSSISPEIFALVKDNIKKQFDSIIIEVKKELDAELKNVETDTIYSKLEPTLHVLLNKLAETDKDVTAKSIQEIVDEHPVTITKKVEEGNIELDIDDDQIVTHDDPLEMESQDESEKYKIIEDDETQIPILDDDKLHVRIRRLDRKPPDTSGKLHEMDFSQRKKLEQAVKERLEKAGLDSGRRIEVKIITAGYYDNEDGKDFNFLSDAESSQFQNMIMTLLTGQQEAIQEMEKHKKLEENYKVVWKDRQKKSEDN